MKRYFLLLTVLSFAFVFEAKEVSYDEALMKASEFFTPASSSKKQVKALNKQLSLATTFKQVNETNKPAFYIINNGQNGFVIVSADDNAKTILGYSDKGAFDADSIPSNVKFWLDYYAQQISSVAQKSISNPLYATGNAYDPIAPLLGAIEHDQSAPYNNLCPTVFGSETPTGCAATAAGQIMTLYKYPAKGKGSADYNYQLSYDGTIQTVTCQADFSKSTYDWSNILDKYIPETTTFDWDTWTTKTTPKNYNETQANAVSLLLRDIGYASQMTYQPGGSGTSDQDVAKAFVNNFSYDKSLKRVVFNAFYAERNQYTNAIIKSENVVWNFEEDIMDELYAELKAGRPIFCAGTDNEGKSGHAFVCDGIQSDGKLHINWGWDGAANGYYELTAFIPTSTGTGAGMGQYTNNISFLTNIKAENKTANSPLKVGLRNQKYSQNTNEFNKSGTSNIVLFKAETTEETDGVYAGYDWFNLGYTDITQMGFGYVLSKDDVTLYSSAAQWIIADFNANIETDYPTYLKLPMAGLNGIGYDITPTGSIATLAQGVQNGVYDLQMAVKDYAVGTFYPVAVWNRGKVKNKIAVGKNKVYIYPASATNYTRNNTPTNLTATQNGSTYTLSWTGNASNYILLTWDEDDLTVEKLSSKSKSGVSAGKNWAVFACETSSSVTYATSGIGYGDVLPVISDEPEKKNIKVTKVWEDNDNQDGLRTTSVTIKLLADGKDAGKTVTLNESNSWTSTFTNLDAKASGKDIVYTVEESSVPTGYTPSITGTADATTGFTIINTHTPETKSIKVTKVWEDNDNQDGLRTTSVTIKLLADGKDAGKTVTLNESNSWTSTFSDLDAKASGKDIVYTVEESSVPTGYTPSVSGTADAGFTITNTHTPAPTPTPETKSIKVTKVWDDNNNQDGLRTTSVTIKLLADGKEAGKTVTLNESNSWTSTFTDLDAKSNGKDIVYTVEESSVPTGYTRNITGTADAGFTITNTHTPETKSVKVTKVWDDNNNQDGLRTTSVTIKLLADGKDAGKTVTLNESNSWTSTFSNLDAQSNGKDIVYTVEESSVPTGYTRNITGTADAGFTITNTHTPETKSVKVTKVWDDNNNQDGLRTTSVTIKLLADGKDAGKTVTLNESNSWTGTFTNLDAKASGKDIVYTVEESSVPTGYTPSASGTADAGFTITNTHTPEKKNIKVTKVWNDNNNQDGLRTTSVTIKLLADGKDAGKTVTLNESNSWTSTFTNLDAKASGKDIAYTVEESSVPSGYTPSVSGTADETIGFTITNTHTPAPTPTPETKSIKVTKVWDDNNNQDGLRTTSVTIKLLADGKETKSETLSASNGWTYTFSNLDAKANGKDIVYTVEESSVPTGYTPSISGTADATTGFTITNTHTPETKNIKVTKVWDDNNNQDGLRTTSVTIKLLADGKEAGKTVTLNESNSWTSTFTNLDAKANGADIVYTVEESSVPSGYTPSITGTADETTGFTITNTHTPAPTPTPETKSIKVTKVWDDNNNQDGLRTTSVTIKLLADGKDAGKTVTLNESNSWTSTFSNLDAQSNGKDIVYTVEESSVPSGYTPSITGTADATTGFTITNTHTPETKSVKVTKVWDDNNNQDGLRTTSVTVKLFADGREVKSEQLSASNGWTYTFTNLDAKANGKNIKYTVEEASVPKGYKRSITGTADAGFTITNTHSTTETKNVRVRIVWDDNSNRNKLRPSSLTIKLLADGAETGKTVILKATNHWIKTFTDLEIQSNGKNIVYTIEEIEIPEYTVTIAEDGTNGFIITNTLISKNDEPDDTPTDVEDVDADKVVISTHHLTIHVKAPTSSAIQIYTVSGDMLYSVQRTHASFRVPHAGVYIVQVGDKKHKVLAR